MCTSYVVVYTLYHVYIYIYISMYIYICIERERESNYVYYVCVHNDTYAATGRGASFAPSLGHGNWLVTIGRSPLL